MACWCYHLKQSSMWNCTREKLWTSWSSDGYDAGTLYRLFYDGHFIRLWHLLSFVNKRKKHVTVLQSTKWLFSTDFNVTRYRLPWQCQDFLSGQETGGGRKWCMSTWSPLAVMSYATANRSQRRLNPHWSALRRSLYFNGEKCEKNIKYEIYSVILLLSWW